MHAGSQCLCRRVFEEENKVPWRRTDPRRPDADKLTARREFLSEIGLSLSGADSPEAPLARSFINNFHKKQLKVVLSDCGSIDPEDIDVYIAGIHERQQERFLPHLPPRM